ncbi:MAG: Crp/Fnr family transcriptional regulator [Actinomycetota bacterium]
MEWPLLERLPPEDVRRVLAAARRRSFGRNEVIFHEGDPADTILLISKGRVLVRTTTPLGHAAALQVLGPGTFVGELALLGGPAVRSATAIALETTEAMAVHKDTFAELRAQHPAVTEILIQILADTVRRQNQQLLEALYVSADTRVRRRVLELLESYGSDTIPLTQEDLAGLAGTTRATVNRVLRDEEKRGSLTLSRGRVTVTDAGAIAKRAT